MAAWTFSTSARCSRESCSARPHESGDPVFAYWIPACAGTSGVLLRGGSPKWGHCSHANLVDSCNFQVSVFTQFALAGYWRQDRGRCAHAEPGVSNAGRDLGPCYFPVMVLLFWCRLLDFLFIFRALR